MISTGFTSFDKLAGGFNPGKTYLLYGNNRSGKTTFALGFTADGLNRGERCVYVSGRPAESVLAQAAAFGFDFKGPLQSQNLVILEYPENVRENSTRLMDDSRIFGEFQAIIGSEHFDRLVFDPVSPLVAGLSAAAAPARLRSMVRLFTAGGAAALYVAGTSTQDNHLPLLKEAASGILRFERDGAEGSPCAIVAERLPGLAPGAPSRLTFELVPGIGMRELSDGERPGEAPSKLPKTTGARLYSFATAVLNTPGAPSSASRTAAPILLIHPDPAERSRLRAMLERLRPVVEAAGVADGISCLASSGPGVVIVARQGLGVTGIEIARKIRQSGRTVPILMLATQCCRRTDVIEPLQAGVDVCLADPPDSRALTLHVNSLLGRSVTRTAGTVALDYTPPPREVGCTSDLDYFLRRLDAEARYAQEYGGSTVLVTLREPFSRTYSDELSNLATVLARSSDLVFAGTRGVAVLLSDAVDAAPFLTRFRARWTEAVPNIEEFHAPEGADYITSARDFLVSTVAAIRGNDIPSTRVISAGVPGGSAARVGEF